MAFTDEIGRQGRAASQRRSLLDVLGLFRRAQAPAKTAPADQSYGLVTEALIDADVARMASFGSWTALREELRARDQSCRSNRP